MNLIPTLKYLLLTIKHKYFVFMAGLKLKAPIYLLIVHDFSKFNLIKETRHYGRQFFGDKKDPLGFSYAWNHHQKRNKHHWEYWIPVTGHNRGGYKDLEPLPMPDKYIKEMVADWVGASRAYEGKYPTKNNWPWFEKSFSRIKLHPDTKQKVLSLVRNLNING